MKLVLSYSLFAAFCLMLYIIDNFLSRRIIKKASRPILSPLEEANIFLQFLNIEEQYLELKAKGLFENIPHIEQLLSDVSKVIDKSKGKIDLQRIFITKVNPKDESYDLLMKESQICPEEVIQLILLRRRIFMEVVFIKNKSSYITNPKKVTEFRILTMIWKLSLISELFALSKHFFKNSDVIFNSRNQDIEISKLLLKNERRVARIFA